MTLESAQKSLVNGVTEFLDSAATGIPTGSPQNESRVIVGHWKDTYLPDIALHIVLRNRVRTIVDAVTESALFIVQRAQSLVEGTV